MIVNNTFENMINAPVRAFRGRVEFYEGSTLALLCGCHDNLKSFTVERVGEENKFFGFGICQKINIHLVDPDRKIHLSTANTAEVVFGKDNDYIYPCPNFYITQVRRDENTNELSITAYDALYNATKHTVAELNMDGNYSLAHFAIACASLLGLPIGELDSSFDTYYEAGANFEGTETIREALDAIAEATQTVYFVNWDWKLVFKKLDKDGDAALTIGKDKYFTLESGDNRRLGAICHATELGDNVIAKLPVAGSTQYVRDNPFWDLREDIATLVDSALANIGGLTINQFDCSWRGNFLLEIGDKIALITKDNKIVYSYVLNDVMSFNGSLSQKTKWHYEDNEGESADNPTSLGDALKQTFAKVDKVNKTVEIVASETAEMDSRISSIEMTTESLDLTVKNVGASVENANERISSIEMTTDSIGLSVQNVETSLDSANESIATLSSRVDAVITAEDVRIEIQNELSKGVDEVTTTTGFTFNGDGLTVSKSGSEMTTQITEDGMTVSRDSNIVLTANNEGVQATNLHAVTYLIIGTNSRFEDYGNRTGCFWIGG
jgi:hypothetical protein